MKKTSQRELDPRDARLLKQTEELRIHLAFSTKHREPLLLAPLRAQIHAYLATVLKCRAAGNAPPGHDLSGGVPAVIGKPRD